MLTRDEVILMAMECQAVVTTDTRLAMFDHDDLERFAAAAYAEGVAAEREACALACEDVAAYWGRVRESGPETGADQCAIAIRQRGTA